MHFTILSLKMTLGHGLTLSHVALDINIIVILRMSIFSGQWWWELAGAGGAPLGTKRRQDFPRSLPTRVNLGQRSPTRPWETLAITPHRSRDTSGGAPLTFLQNQNRVEFQRAPTGVCPQLRRCPSKASNRVVGQKSCVVRSDPASPPMCTPLKPATQGFNNSILILLSQKTQKINFVPFPSS